MTAPVVIRKAGQVWELSPDLDCIDAIVEMAPLWGCTIGAETAPHGAAIPIRKECKTMSTRRQIVEFAKSYIGGEVPIAKADVLHALEATAAKRGVSLSKFVETPAGSALYRIYKNAPGSDVQQRPVFKTSYEALEWEKSEHIRKSGLADAG